MISAHRIEVEWTGNTGAGTSAYRAYSRDHTVSAEGLPPILASSDFHFHGDRSRYNPELLLVAAVAECHMLTYLHLAVKSGITVISYRDEANGTLATHPDDSGEITEVVLHPEVVVTSAIDVERASTLHDEVDELCFIARSVRFPIRCAPTTTAVDEGQQ